MKLIDAAPSIIKVLYKAIESFASKASWEGYFILAQEENQNIDRDVVIDVAKYTYKQSFVKVVKAIKELLVNKGYSDSDINSFLLSLLDKIKTSQPLLYVLIQQDLMNSNIEELKLDKQKLDKELEELKSSYCFNLNYYTIDELNNYLYRSSRDSENKPLTLDLFDFQDAHFSDELSESLRDPNNPLLIKGTYQLETLYATLCELKKIFPDDYNSRVFILNSRADYLNVQHYSLPNNSILINAFFTDESIPVIRQYTNIHIVSKWKISGVQITLRPRLAKSTIDALKKSNFNSDDISSLLRRSRNTFPNLYRILCKETDTLEARIKSSIKPRVLSTSLLIKKFQVNNPLDAEFIEKISGLEISDYIEEIQPPSLSETPYAKEIVDFHQTNLVVLDYEGSFESFHFDISSSIADKFFGLAKKVLCTLPDKYGDSPLVFKSSESSYSPSLIESIFISLIFLNEKGKFKNQTANLVDTFIKWIDENQTDQHYRYLSDYLDKIVEINASLTLDKISSDIKCKSGLCRLFLNKSSKPDFIFGKNWYTNVLWCLEKILFFDSERKKAIETLFSLYQLNLSYQISNSPKSTLHVFFLAWFQATPASEEERTELCRHLFKIDSNAAFDLFIDLLYSGGGDTATPFNHPVYLTFKMPEQQLTNEVIFERYNFYNDIVLEYSNNCTQIAKIIDKHSFVYFGKKAREMVAKKIMSVCKEANDYDKIIVINAIKSFIHKNREFANSGWAAPEEVIKDFELLIPKIKFDNPEIEYIDYFTSFEIKNPDPVVYDRDNYSYELQEKNNDQFLETVYAKFKKDRLSIDYLYQHFNENAGNINVFDRFYYFAKDFEMTVNNKSLNQFVEILLAKTPNVSALFSYLGRDLFYNDKKNYYSILKQIQATNNKLALLEYLYVAPFNLNDDEFVSMYQVLPRCVQDLYWSNFKSYVNIDCSNPKSITFAIESLNDAFKRDNSLKSPILEALYFFAHNYKGNDLGDVVLECLTKAEPGAISSSHLMYLPLLLDILHERFSYTNNETIELQIASLEIMAIKTHECEPICLYNHLGKHPETYFEFIESVYIKKEEDSKRKATLFGLLYFDLKFCPGYYHGAFDGDLFKQWVNQYRELIYKTDFDEKDYLFYSSLGKLFAYAKKEEGLLIPKEAANFIENIQNDKAYNYLKSSYCTSIMNGVGVRTVGDGSDLIAKANYYKSESHLLNQAGFSKSALILNDVADCFYHDAESERRFAENE